MIADNKLYQIWDRLAAFTADEIEDATDFLMSALSEIIDADNAYWVGVIKLVSPKAQTTVDGWRPKILRYLHEKKSNQQIYKKMQKKFATGYVDQTVVELVKHAGKFRSLLWRDILPSEWFKSKAYDDFFGVRDIRDQLYATFPVNRDTESYFCFQRIGRDDRFTKADVAVIRDAMRPLKWFHRHIFLSYGLPVANKPLSPIERKVQQLLLTELTEKEIAHQLGHTVATTHQYVTTIFRKMGVSGRAGLTALWLGADPLKKKPL